MAKRKKLQRFQDIHKFPNVFESPEEIQANPPSQPYILELACGKAYYTLALAKDDPSKTVIGVDIKGERIWVGATQAQEEGVENAYFIRDDIRKIVDYLPANSVEEIWITFPDPFPKDRHEKRRLTHPNFLKLYKQVLSPKGIVHLKTDDLDLFNFTLDILKEEKAVIHEVELDIYKNGYQDKRLEIQTPFEQKHLEKGRTINHVSFSL